MASALFSSRNKGDCAGGAAGAQKIPERHKTTTLRSLVVT